MKHAMGLLVVAMGLAGCMAGTERYRQEIRQEYPQLRTIEPIELTVAPETNDAPTLLRIEPGTEVELGIDRCRALALQNNLDLNVEMFRPQIADEQVREALAAFEPLFLSQLGFMKTDSPIPNSLEASQATSMYGRSSLSIPLRTGGSLEVSMPIQRDETDNAFATYNEYYSTDLGLTLRHELLRGAGPATAQSAIRIAQISSELQMAQTRLQAGVVLAAVDRAYWRLYAAREALRVRRMEHELAIAQLERARRMRDVNEAPEIDVIRFEAAAAERLEAIIVADNALRDRERELKLAINAEGLEMESDSVVVPTTQPNSTHYAVDRAALLEHALENRMEQVTIELQMLSNEETVDRARNGLLPLLTLDYTYNINGLGPVEQDALDMIGENHYADHRVGLTIQVPLGNVAARSRYQQALLSKQQLMANREAVEKQIRREVLAAVDSLESTWLRVKASRASRELAERQMQMEQRQYELGLMYSTEVLDSQTRYASALLAEINALAEYQISQIDLCHATGSLNDTARIVWDDDENRFVPDALE